MEAAVRQEIRTSWEWLLRRPQRVARLLAAWPSAADTLADVLEELRRACHAAGVEPRYFVREFDPEVTIDPGGRTIRIELREL